MRRGPFNNGNIVIPLTTIDKIYADVPEADKRKIWAGNAVEFFSLAN